MAEDTFRFLPKQREELLKYCWTRKADKLLAEQFLDSAELHIAAWLLKTKSPPTTTRHKIKHAERLYKAAAEMASALEAMPQDVAKFLNIGWLRDRYGDAYFKWHSEACSKDKENQLDYMTQVFLNALAGKERTNPITEYSKLPPDMMVQVTPTIDFLKSMTVSANAMATMNKEAKQWQNKEMEKALAITLALEYGRIFGKLPSPANGSSFRSFAARLYKILGYELGANVIAYACDAVRIHAKATAKS